MSTIYGYGQGGKHRDTPEAAAWRTATTRITARLIAWAVVTDPAVARLQAEDLIAAAARAAR